MASLDFDRNLSVLERSRINLSQLQDDNWDRLGDSEKSKILASGIKKITNLFSRAQVSKGIMDILGHRTIPIYDETSGTMTEIVASSFLDGRGVLYGEYSGEKKIAESIGKGLDDCVKKHGIETARKIVKILAEEFKTFFRSENIPLYSATFHALEDADKERIVMDRVRAHIQEASDILLDDEGIDSKIHTLNGILRRFGPKLSGIGATPSISSFSIIRNSLIEWYYDLFIRDKIGTDTQMKVYSGLGREEQQVYDSVSGVAGGFRSPQSTLEHESKERSDSNIRLSGFSFFAESLSENCILKMGISSMRKLYTDGIPYFLGELGHDSLNCSVSFDVRALSDIKFFELCSGLRSSNDSKEKEDVGSTIQLGVSFKIGGENIINEDFLKEVADILSKDLGGKKVKIQKSDNSTGGYGRLEKESNKYYIHESGLTSDNIILEQIGGEVFAHINLDDYDMDRVVFLTSKIASLTNQDSEEKVDAQLYQDIYRLYGENLVSGSELFPVSGSSQYEEFYESVIYPHIEGSGVSKGHVLLVGGPGTGKSQMAMSLFAQESHRIGEQENKLDATIIYLSNAQIGTLSDSNSESFQRISNIRNRCGRDLLLITEDLDTGFTHPIYGREFEQGLTLVTDGVGTFEGLKLVATANYVQGTFPPRHLRGGRFDTIVHFKLLEDEEEILAAINTHADKNELDLEEEIKNDLVEKFRGKSYSMIADFFKKIKRRVSFQEFRGIPIEITKELVNDIYQKLHFNSKEVAEDEEGIAKWIEAVRDKSLGGEVGFQTGKPKSNQ